MRALKRCIEKLVFQLFIKKIMFLSLINKGMKPFLSSSNDHPSSTIRGMFLLTKKDYDLGHINEIIYTANISKDDQIKTIFIKSCKYITF